MLWVGVSAFPIHPLSVRGLAAPGLCENEQFTITSTPASWTEFNEIIQCNTNVTVVLVNQANIAVIADDADMLHRWLRNIVFTPGFILVLPRFDPTPSIPRTVPVAVSHNKNGWPVVEIGTFAVRYFRTSFTFDTYDPRDSDLFDTSIQRVCIDPKMRIDQTSFSSSACQENYFFVTSGDTYCVERGTGFDQIVKSNDCGSDGWNPLFKFKSASFIDPRGLFITVCERHNEISFDCNDDKLWLIKSHTIDSSAVHFHKTNTSLEWANSNDELTYQAKFSDDEQTDVWCIGFFDEKNTSVCIHRGRCNNVCHKGYNVQSFDLDDIDLTQIKYMRHLNCIERNAIVGESLKPVFSKKNYAYVSFQFT